MRIERITEKLLFGEKGVEQFMKTYNAMKRSVDLTRERLKNRNTDLKDMDDIDNGFHVQSNYSVNYEIPKTS